MGRILHICQTVKQARHILNEFSRELIEEGVAHSIDFQLRRLVVDDTENLFMSLRTESSAFLGLSGIELVVWEDCELPTGTLPGNAYECVARIIRKQQQDALTDYCKDHLKPDSLFEVPIL